MIRKATLPDLPQIVAIYNQAITAGFQVGFTRAFAPTEREAWLTEHIDSAYPLWVYEHDNEIAGWISISPYRKGRDAFRHTVEISYFVDNRHVGKGIATQLLSYALNACKLLGYKTILAILLDRNVASMRLLQKFSFAEWGRMPGVADFDGDTCDHLYYGIQL